jgi:hypothetical protein
MRRVEKPPAADLFARMKASNPQWAAEMAVMLRKAGLPE